MSRSAHIDTIEAAETKPRRGVKTRLFGVVLIFLGGMDSMLSWRGGGEPSEFYIFLLGGGAFFYALGLIRKNRAG
ncbi:MAG: hypothetical protein QF578_21400 [Alphaproteobacteria bacterium]|jgi:hypothetical protein|nr:hypothetical protein [Alphaproteobacteria bacterium]MDP6567400.1 hypothetical protein [Alphaproteobacteria bacterium]MDP6813000.1 hypothetical protein [Alphaproteobacteria bacterium]